MIDVRRGSDRFCTRTGWLTSWHSFSYGQHYDPANVGFGPLVVSNHDVLVPGAGFDDLRHSGVDLVTYVVSGGLEHRDSAGHHAVVSAGELQLLRSGAGLVHSERNASAEDPVEYVQMWLRSDGPATSYERPHGGSVVLPAGVLRVVELGPGDRVGWPEDEPVHVYLVSGRVTDGQGLELSAGDAIRLSGTAIDLSAETHSTLLAWSLANG
ncbi:MAG: quercetin 2,3-dioxygenase [Frankiales bacterium]|nr:quercetin 2,3-dioxygenase [Frankiales bacterium]